MCKQAIIRRTTLAHRDDTKRLCVFCDASDSNWSGSFTQVPHFQLSLPHFEQQQEPIEFHSGRFSPTQLSWSTLEKDAFSVLASFECSHLLAVCPSRFYLYSDHNNFLFIFDRLTWVRQLGKKFSVGLLVSQSITIFASTYVEWRGQHFRRSSHSMEYPVDNSTPCLHPTSFHHIQIFPLSPFSYHYELKISTYFLSPGKYCPS